MKGTKSRVSCRELFYKFNILPLASEFLLPLLFIVGNMKKLQTKFLNSDIHRMSTRYGHDIHIPNTNLSKYQKRGLLVWN
jgi:hypothetical protein